MAAEPPESTEVNLAWIGLDETPILFANQFVVQFQPNEFVLTVGQAQPPVLLGTPEQVSEQLQEIDYVAVRSIARIGMTRGRLVELIAALQANLGNHDQAMASIDPTSP